MDVCSGYRQEQTPAGKDDAATLTLHFCDEDFASAVRKRTTTPREHSGTDIRTPHFLPICRSTSSPHAFTSESEIG
jgi:hypothetical protein